MEIDTILGQAQDVDEKLFPYYLYRHIRKDNGQVFYVGIGVKDFGYTNRYRRAFSHKRSNRFWNAIVAKTEFDVEIILESNSRDYIQEKEIEFIKLYGRRDKKTGTLCNLTDGGDNGLNKSQDVIDRQIATAKRTGSYDVMCNRIRKYAHKKGEIPVNIIKKTFAYNINGTFLGEFSSRSECGMAFGIKGTHIAKMVTHKVSCKRIVASDTDLGINPDLSNFKIRPDKIKPVEVTDILTGKVKIYTKTIDVLKEVGISRRHLYRLCSANGGTMKHKFKYV